MIPPLFFFFFFLNKENKTDYIHRKDKEKHVPNTDNYDCFFLLLCLFSIIYNECNRCEMTFFQRHISCPQTAYNLAGVPGSEHLPLSCRLLEGTKPGRVYQPPGPQGSVFT